MNHTTTILGELERFVKENNLNTNQLAKLSGLNPGTVSSILNNKKVLSVDQLDRLTKTLKLPEGYFYEQYIKECLNEVAPNWRRIKPFLCRCVELEKLNCLKQTVDLLIDNLVYSPLLFDTAEVFFNNDKVEAAALLYKYVAESEIRQHSERLALCHYRLFIIQLRNHNQAENLRVATQFEMYIDRLDEMDQLDGLKELANTYRSLKEWDRLEKIVDKLHPIAHALYFEIHRNKKMRHSPKKTGRPLFFYLAYSSLLRAEVSEGRGDYKLALHYTNEYADLSWVQETDEETLHWKNLFNEWAEANTYLNKLLSGELEILSDYLAYIERNPDELLFALLNILKAANQFNFDIDDILLKFDDQITSYLETRQTIGVYNDTVVDQYSLYLFYEIAEYYLTYKKESKGFKYLLECLERSVIIKNSSDIFKCMVLFENNRHMASSDTITAYHNLMEEVYLNEKNQNALVNG